MPDEAREVIFPKGIPVSITKEAFACQDTHKNRKQSDEKNEKAHESEGDLTSEAAEIKEQADHSISPEGGQNLV